MKTAVINKEILYTYLDEIKDPEIPVLSIVDMGIVRDVIMNDDAIEIVITPTYTGCPAMDMIAASIRVQMATLGFKQVKVSTTLSPAWTTEWMTAAGKQQLKAYGIAPPNPKQQVCSDSLFSEESIQCPHCNSYHTHRISEFGSTACKALYQCDDCKEPFDYFKCH